MNLKHEFWEAFLLVGVPIVALGTVLLYWVRPAGWGEWFVYVAVFVVLFALLVPLIYGIDSHGPRLAPAKRYALAGVLYLMSGAAFAVDEFLGGHLFPHYHHYAVAVALLALGFRCLTCVRAEQAADSDSPSSSAD